MHTTTWVEEALCAVHIPGMNIIRVWIPGLGPLYSKNCELLENAQRRAPKLVPGVKDMPDIERLAALKLPSLFYWRSRGHLIELY